MESVILLNIIKSVVADMVIEFTIERSLEVGFPLLIVVFQLLNAPQALYRS